MDTFVNLSVINKLKVPKNINLKTINGQSLVNCGDGCEDIDITGSSTNSNVLIDGGTFLVPTNSVLIDAGSFV